MKRFLYWWYGLTSFVVAPLACGAIWGNTGAGFGICGALLINGAIIAAYEYRYPPTNIP